MVEDINYNFMKYASEKEVAKHLDKLGINWVYENPVFVYDDEGRPRVWTPDFYLPELGIYIEVCGNDKFNYEFREKIYKKMGISVVFLHWYKTKNKWKAYLSYRIMEIEESRHVKTKETIGLLRRKNGISIHHHEVSEK